MFKKISILLIISTLLFSMGILPSKFSQTANAQNEPIIIEDRSGPRKPSLQNTGFGIGGGSMSSSTYMKNTTNKIKQSLLNANNQVVLSNFTQRIRGTQNFKDPKSGWIISRDRAKTNAHGGSYWKLLNPAGKRMGTLDAQGNILRE